MAGAYAEGTKVDAPQSRAEIEKTVERFGAEGFGYRTQGKHALIEFVARGRHVRFVITLPDPRDAKFTLTETLRTRTDNAAAEEYRKEVRRLWRSLALVIKAKLAAVEDGIVSFESEFAMQTVMPDGRTAAEHILPALQTALESGTAPTLLALEGPRG
jgi:hypothetical protein